MTQTELIAEQRPLAAAADVVARICALPAVATQDWFDAAAGTLAPVRQDAVVSLSLAVLGPQGEIRNLEATGAFGVDANARPVSGEMLHPEHAGSIGWWFDEPLETTGPRAERVASLTCAGHWTQSAGGRRWANLGVTDLGVGEISMTGPAGRTLLLELASTSASEPIERWELAVIRAMLPHLAHRAMMAFGGDVSSPSSRLTHREQQILEHLALGKSVKQIAGDLARSPHTVHDHVKSLHRKLNASSRGELIARALGHLAGHGKAAQPIASIGVEPKIPSLLSA